MFIHTEVRHSCDDPTYIPLHVRSTLSFWYASIYLWYITRIILVKRKKLLIILLFYSFSFDVLFFAVELTIHVAAKTNRIVFRRTLCVIRLGLGALLQSPQSCRYAPPAQHGSSEVSSRRTNFCCLSSLARRFVPKLHCPTLHCMGGFVLPHGRPLLRSFAWAVSPVTVTAPLANLAF